MKIEQIQGMTQITCQHAAAFNEPTRPDGLERPKHAAPTSDGIELEPGGVLFLCCSWCAAFIRENALRSMIKDGVSVTLQDVQRVTMVDEGFVRRMEHELRENADQGDWEDYAPSDAQLAEELHHHVEKLCLDLASANRNRSRISEHAADLANYCMKVHERFGTDAIPQSPPPRLDFAPAERVKSDLENEWEVAKGLDAEVERCGMHDPNNLRNPDRCLCPAGHKGDHRYA